MAKNVFNAKDGGTMKKGIKKEENIDVWSEMRSSLNNIDNEINTKAEKDRYLNELRKRIKEEFEEKGMLPKLQTNIAIKNCEEHTELRVITNEFTIKPQKNGYQFKSENPELYITSEKEAIRIICKKTFLHIESKKNTYWVLTNNPNIKVDCNVQGLSKEDDVLGFYVQNLTELEIKDKTLIVKIYDATEKNNVSDNKTLIISNIDGKVYLPYNAEELKQNLHMEKNKTKQEIIQEKYVVPISNFSHPIKARYIEGYKLMRYKEGKSNVASILFGIELMFEFSLHPAIITACKSVDELDIYLDCLEDNELDKFSCFKIVYQTLPMINKKSKKVHYV